MIKIFYWNKTPILFFRWFCISTLLILELLFKIMANLNLFEESCPTLSWFSLSQGLAEVLIFTSLKVKYIFQHKNVFTFDARRPSKSLSVLLMFPESIKLFPNPCLSVCLDASTPQVLVGFKFQRYLLMNFLNPGGDDKTIYVHQGVQWNLFIWADSSK